VGILLEAWIVFDAVIAGKAKMVKFLDDTKRQPRHWTGEASDDGVWKTGWFYAVPLDELISVEVDLHRFCSGQVLMLSGPLFEGHGRFPAEG